ncbi:hypothetical protein [Rossellomorea sp. LjRoot5]|uniref:hypothetical protein n=1 Tax=Rossellomorea sp. LjRoot5 TaxID=3342331 RepID=UPI003ED01B30
MNIVIEIKQHQGRFGVGYRSLSAKDGNGEYLSNDISGNNVVDFVENAIQEGIKQIIAKDASAEAFTVDLPAGIVLGAELSAILVQKFEADPLVSSLAFN